MFKKIWGFPLKTLKQFENPKCVSERDELEKQRFCDFLLN